MEDFPYDITQYESHPYPQTQPEWMFTMARLFGLHPTDFTQCRVLELGCASGGNILPLAFNFKSSHFTGIDLSMKQIEKGLEQIRDLQLSNIQLLHKSIMDVDSTYGKFDYIICHGVFSWVSKEVQDKILSICKDNLASNGIAYVSYNTLPGWNMVKSIRELMLYHTQGFETHQEKVRQARLILKFVADSLEGQNTPYANFLRSEVELLSKTGDFYLLHDHLEQCNDPVYFHTFVECAGKKGLSYLSDVQLSGMYVNNLPEKVSSQINKITDIIQLNQYMDFIRNQRFRCTLLCHKEEVINRSLRAEDLENFYISYLGTVRNDIKEENLAEGTTLQFIVGSGTLTLKRRILKIAMKIIHDQYRKPISFLKLLSFIKDQSGERDEAKIKEFLHGDLGLMRLVLGGFLQLHSSSGQYSQGEIKKPKASELAQFQIKKQKWVTNQRHEIVVLNAIESKLLTYCDGTKEWKDILEKMYTYFLEGELKIKKENGEEITEKKVIEAQVEILCKDLIDKMGKSALWVSN